MFQFVVKEDTFTPWVDKKMQGLPSFSEKLMTLLGNLFLEETDPFVPTASGSLLESAHYMWSFVEALPTVGLYITWTGLFNDSDEEFKDLRNYYHEDYAWSVYHGKIYKKKGTPSSSYWVDESLSVFDDELTGFLEEVFLGYLEH